MSKCSGVTPGGKDALNCLQKNVASLAPACKTAVSATIPAPRAGRSHARTSGAGPGARSGHRYPRSRAATPGARAGHHHLRAAAARH